MKGYLFETNCQSIKHWFIEVLTPYENGVLFKVYNDLPMDWAEEHLKDETVTIGEWDYVSEWKEDHTMIPHFFLSVDVWPKYYFPKFARFADDYDYQLYEVGDIDAIAALVKECIRKAGEMGVVLGSR